MKVIAIANQKGGVAKTTTALALFSCLQQMGKKCLFIDTDDRRDASDTFGAESKDVATIFDVMLTAYDEGDEKTTAMAAIQHARMGDIIPADRLLSEFDQKISTLYTGRELLLKTALDEMPQDAYDFVIIDTQPFRGAVLVNSLVATDYCIGTITPDRYSLRGIDELAKTTVKQVRRSNPNFNFTGLLMTKCDPRLNISKLMLGAAPELEEKLNTKIFSTKIREGVDARRAQVERKGLLECAPYGNVALDYKKFTQELLERIGM